jgi:Peptidase family M50
MLHPRGQSVWRLARFWEYWQRMSDEEQSKPDVQPPANDENSPTSGSSFLHSVDADSGPRGPAPLIVMTSIHSENGVANSHPNVPAVSFAAKPASPQPRFSFRRVGLPLVMFVLTCLSTVLAGLSVPPVTSSFPPAPPTVWEWIFSACTYALAVLGILLFHEFGHYLQSVRYGVRTSLPYFLPMPISPIGTMGAVIFQDARSADRKQLFDIAISGPLAGLVVAIPVAWFGAINTIVIPQAELHGISYVDPPILKWMYQMAHPQMLPNDDVLLNPLLFAGWVGILITALNLVPIGQLDGGHLMYALLGKRAHVISATVIGIALGYMFYTGDFTFSVMLTLMVAVGWRHPPTANDRVPLGWPRVLLGWATLAFLFVGFTPTLMIQNDSRFPTQRRPIVVPREDDLLVKGNFLIEPDRLVARGGMAIPILAKGLG